jgi:hypothetical protein
MLRCYQNASTFAIIFVVLDGAVLEAAFYYDQDFHSSLHIRRDPRLLDDLCRSCNFPEDHDPSWFVTCPGQPSKDFFTASS